MTTVRPAPNWYADPTARHEARYWDGFTWTAHVADGGIPGLDPLVRTTPVAAAAPEAGEVLGPGTAQLRAMADAAAARTGQAGSAPVAAVPARTRRTAYDVVAAVAMVVVIVLGGYVLWSGRLGGGSDDGGRAGDPVAWAHDGYRFDLPPSWVETAVPAEMGTMADGAFRVIDARPVVAYVADAPETLAQITGPEQVLAALASTIATVPTAGGGTPLVTATDVVAEGDRFIGVVVADIDAAGTVYRAVEHLVVTKRGSVVILLYGAADGVDRHRDDARAVARSVRVR